MGNLMGKFLDYDTTSQRNYLNNYMSIRVRLNANDPLMRRKKLRKPEGTMSSWLSCRRPRFSGGGRRISVGGSASKLVSIGAMEEGGGGTVGIRSSLCQ
ncbi:hypothetical protein GOBAR_DD12150 [Gossypium barbadense]|nr:hypothetical protein GOBAR_DD12150 [Gossypium barbadense]